SRRRRSSRHPPEQSDQVVEADRGYRVQSAHGFEWLDAQPHCARAGQPWWGSVRETKNPSPHRAIQSDISLPESPGAQCKDVTNAPADARSKKGRHENGSFRSVYLLNARRRNRARRKFVPATSFQSTRRRSPSRYFREATLQPSKRAANVRPTGPAT